MIIRQFSKSAVWVVGLVCGFAGMALAEGKPAEDWLKEIRPGVGKERAAVIADPVLYGAALDIHHYYKKDKEAIYAIPLKDEQKAAVKAFNDFMAEKGEGLVEKMLAGESLPAGDEKYRYAIAGVIIDRAQHNQKKKYKRSKEELAPYEAFKKQVISQGAEVLRKGYLGESLTPEDIDRLRQYMIYFELKCTMGPVLPFHMRMSTPDDAETIGKPAPSLAAPIASAVWKKPSYSDDYPSHLADLMTQWILIEPLIAFGGYEPVEGTKKVRAKEELGVEGFADGEVIRLSDFKGKKPVVLAMAGPSDGWNWHWKLCNFFDYIQSVYGDQVQFIFIATSVHDSTMSVYDYINPGHHSIYRISKHPLTFEERARVAKLFYMSYPHFTLDYHLDNPEQTIRDNYTDEGGNAHYVFINKDGTLARHFRIRYLKEYIPKGNHSLAPVLLMRASILEQALHAVLQNDGELPQDFAPDVTFEKDAPWGAHNIFFTGKIAEAPSGDTLSVQAGIDPSRCYGYQFWKQHPDARLDPRSLAGKILPALRKWIEEEGGKPVRTFKVPAEKFIFLNGKPAALSDLKKGDHVAVQYEVAKDTASAPMEALVIRASRLP